MMKILLTFFLSISLLNICRSNGINGIHSHTSTQTKTGFNGQTSIPKSTTPLLHSHDISYRPTDSIRVEKMLAAARRFSRPPVSWLLHFGYQFIGTPYVGGTLDRAEKERLVVNLRELDCTTFVEQALALARCAQRGDTSFHSFCDQLCYIRYIGGKVEYTKRQHYFTTWINDNQKEQIVKDIQSPTPPFTAIQTIRVDYMTTHTSSYKMLYAHPEWLAGIRNLEQDINGLRYRYIPKALLANQKLIRTAIRDGDIIVILTNKRGLDTSHIGLAVWRNGNLHMLNASSIHKKVIDEPMTLYQYMQRHPSQIGIRICRMN